MVFEVTLRTVPETKEVKDRCQRFCQSVGPFGMHYKVEKKSRVKVTHLAYRGGADKSRPHFLQFQSGARVTSGRAVTR